MLLLSVFYILSKKSTDSSFCVYAQYLIDLLNTIVFLVLWCVMADIGVWNYFTTFCVCRNLLTGTSWAVCVCCRYSKRVAEMKEWYIQAVQQAWVTRMLQHPSIPNFPISSGSTCHPKISGFIEGIYTLLIVLVNCALLWDRDSIFDHDKLRWQIFMT